MSKFLEIVLLIPATIYQVIMDVLKVVDIGLLITDTFPQVIVGLVDVGKV